nr:hypothetical protein [Tanacetum cinerariifolium]
MFTTIKLVSRHQNTQQFDAMFPIELTNTDIKNSKAYKEYYAVATGATPPKTKAITPLPTAAAGTRLSTSAKGKQPAKPPNIHDEEETEDEESFDPIPKTLEHMDDEGNDEENLGLNVGMDEGLDEEDDEDKLYGDVNINLKGRVVQMADVHTTQEFENSHVTLTLVNP